jgi:hypothetical protein
MSIENNLASIAKSLESIAKSLESANTSASVVATQVAQPEVVQSDAVTMGYVEQLSIPPQPVAPPVPPVVATGVPTTSPAPFSDPKGLITYVMASYKALGPEKGANIQGVLTALGYQNINEVKPEAYGALYAGVEALK